MNDAFLAFDGPAHWGDATIGLGYELDVYPGHNGFGPHIEIEHPTTEITYHFIQSFDEIGTFTPGYAIASPPLTKQLLDVGVYSLPDELPVESWMPAAIERAGFAYDPVSNAERRRDDGTVRVPRGQATLTEVSG